LVAISDTLEEGFIFQICNVFTKQIYAYKDGETWIEGD